MGFMNQRWVDKVDNLMTFSNWRWRQQCWMYQRHARRAWTMPVLGKYQLHPTIRSILLVSNFSICRSWCTVDHGKSQDPTMKLAGEKWNLLHPLQSLHRDFIWVKQWHSIPQSSAFLWVGVVCHSQPWVVDGIVFSLTLRASNHHESPVNQNESLLITI